MRLLKVSEIVKAVNGKIINGNIDKDINGISTDSRTIKKGMLFVPLLGENFDGHDYINAAADNGAFACLTQKDTEIKNKETILIKVNDTLAALKDIAAYYRSKFLDIPFVAVTGSVGKTSTKEMIANILGEKYNVLKTLGNYNNEIGLPLTMFRLTREHQIAVIEMGMSNFGEIKSLASIVKPQTAVITNIGVSHIENLGSRENILKAKLEIFSYFNNNNLAILNGDDKLLWGLRNKLPFKAIYIGIKNKESDIIAYDIKSYGEKGTEFKVKINNSVYQFKLDVPGVHNIYNSLIGLAIGIKYNVSIENIVKGVRNYSPEKMRMNIINTKNYKVIDDCYNASPDSMKAAIKVLEELGKGKIKAAILGDMLEMGEFALKAHEEIGDFVCQSKIDYLITLGNHSKMVGKGAKKAGMNPENILHFDTTEEINNFIENNNIRYDVILIKGSRGMKMEHITKYITEKNIKE